MDLLLKSTSLYVLILYNICIFTVFYNKFCIVKILHSITLFIKALYTFNPKYLNFTLILFTFEPINPYSYINTKSYRYKHCKQQWWKELYNDIPAKGKHFKLNRVPLCQDCQSDASLYDISVQILLNASTNKATLSKIIQSARFI